MSMKNLLAILATLTVAGSLTACNVEECETTEDCDVEAGETCAIELGEETGVCEGPDDGSGPGPSGCTTDAQCGAGYLCDTDNGACFTSCVSGSECAEGYQCDVAAGAASGSCIIPAANPYSWVALVSTAAGDDSTAADNPGPDVDAIELRQGTATLYANSVASSAVGTVTGGDNNTGAPGNVTGPPNDFAGPDADCNLESATGYFAFGGAGGFVAVTFAGVSEIATNDVIKVYELAGGAGNCANISTDRPDSFNVFIGRGAAPATSADITSLANTCQVGSSPALGGITEVTVNTATCN